MTERLRDVVDAEEPALAELAQLVRATGDLDPPIGAQERVRLRLAELGRRRRRSLRPLLVVLVLVAAAPVVIAGVRQLVAPAPAPAPTRATPPSTASDSRTDERAAPSRRRSPIGQERPAAPTLVPDTAQDVRAAPEVPRRRERTPAPGPAREPAPTEVPSAPPTAADIREPETTAQDVAVTVSDPTVEPPPVRPSEPPAEAEHVLRALRLLRQDHDAAGALRELDHYRARYPHGDLAEEALALAMEARAGLEDRAARVLAEQYLRQFPRGRFRALAEVIQRRFHER